MKNWYVNMHIIIFVASSDPVMRLQTHTHTPWIKLHLQVMTKFSAEIESKHKNYNDLLKFNSTGKWCLIYRKALFKIKNQRT